MHSLQSKNMPVSGSTITKPFILLHLTIVLGGRDYSFFVVVVIHMVVCHIICCSADSGSVSLVQKLGPLRGSRGHPYSLLTSQIQFQQHTLNRL